MLTFAPGEGEHPLSLYHDKAAEYLCFLSIFCGERRPGKEYKSVHVHYSDIVLHIEVRLPVLLCAVKTVEGDFLFCWTTTPNVGQTHKENPNLVRILYMVCTLYDIYRQYNKLHEH